MKRPLAVVGVTVLLTDMLAVFMPHGVTLPFAAFFTVLAIAIWRIKPTWLTVRIVLISAVFAMLLMTAYRYKTVDKVDALIGETQNITAEVTNVSNGFSQETINADIKVLTVDGEKTDFSAFAYSLPLCNIGDVLSFSAEASAPENNEYIYSNYAKGIFVVYDKAENINIISHNESILLQISKLKTYASTAITQLIPRETGAVFTAMSTGDKTKLDATTKTYFKRAGISHVLVVSGLHLSMLAAAFFYCMKRFLKRRSAGTITCVFIVFIMLFMGMSTSVARSGIALLLVYSGMLFNRQSDIYTSLGVAALLLCILNPYAAVDVGLLLSLSATLSVVIISEQREKALNKSEDEGKLKTFAVNAGYTAAVPAVATLSTLPVLICIGEGVSLVSVFSGIIAVALLPFIVVLGLLTAVFYYVPFCMFVARVTALIGALLVNVIIKLAFTISKIPFSFVHIYGLAAFGIFVLAAVIVYAGIKTRFKTRKSITLAVAFAIVSTCVYMLADYDVVHITLAGNRANPAIVITQGFDTAVIFRGSQSTAGVEDTLELYNRENVNFAADLRLSANTPAISDRFKVNEIVSVNENVFSSATYKPFRDIIITLHRQADGVYAIISDGGYDMCVSSGKVNLENEKGIDTYIAGSSQPQNLVCDKIIVYSSLPQWAQRYNDKITQTDRILLRKDTSVIYR